jgi:DNA repair photolyase
MNQNAIIPVQPAGHIQVRDIVARGILTETRGFTSVEVPGTGFHYSLNPYRGCAFNCSYCYAPAFVFDDGARQNWGRWVEVKSNAVELLRDAGRRGKLRGKNVYMSTVTDPYQPVERKLELIRACLQVLLAYPPRLLTVQTRSPLVMRDIDLFREMVLGRIAVCMSITTDDETVRRIFEPQCAPIAARIEAIRSIREAGIPTQASIAPVLPSDPEHLAAMLDPAVDWVVVSTFRDDGGQGRKTRAQAAELYQRHGYGNYLHQGDALAERTIETLRRVLGPERVRVGKDGFDQVCRDLGVDEQTAEQRSFL